MIKMKGIVNNSITFKYKIIFYKLNFNKKIFFLII